MATIHYPFETGGKDICLGSGTLLPKRPSYPKVLLPQPYRISWPWVPYFTAFISNRNLLFSTGWVMPSMSCKKSSSASMIYCPLIYLNLTMLEEAPKPTWSSHLATLSCFQNCKGSESSLSRARKWLQQACIRIMLHSFFKGIAFNEDCCSGERSGSERHASTEGWSILYTVWSVDSIIVWVFPLLMSTISLGVFCTIIGSC